MSEPWPAEAVAERSTEPLGVELVPARSPLGLLAEARARGLAPAFFWHDRHEASIGLGEIDRVEASGPERLARIDRLLEARLASDPSLAGKRWFGGFSFEPEVSDDFEGFGSARFIRPRYLWSHRAGAPQAQLIVNTPSARDREQVLAWAHSSAPSPRPLERGADVDTGSFEGWTRAMARAREALDGRSARKVVLSRDVTVRRAERIDPARVLAGLPARSSAEAAFSFFAPSGCFLGLTPERLLKVEGGRLRTEALAGSSAPDDPDGQGLLESAKDREEHGYVVDHLVSRLRDLAEVVEVPEEPTLRRLGHLAHLCTSIEARGLRIRSILSAADALHPTPAVGGVPAEAAFAVIAEAEGRRRGWYAGAVGWLEPDLRGPGRGELRVALRSALLRGRSARIFVGAGIVPASTVEGEWRETAVKASRMLRALGGE